MLFITSFLFAALAGNSLAGLSSDINAKISRQESLTITEGEVDILDLYASYSASAPCNVYKEIGASVSCAQNCDRAVEDKPIILGTYSGDITEFAAYMAVVESRRQIIFVGRGTCGDANWNTDKNFTLIPNDLAEGALIHGGFQLAWSEIADSVLNTLQAAVSRYQDYDIVFTGGSLGGAVATVAGANLRAAGYDVDIYSYGSPRIGNDILSEFIQQQPGKIYRVTHNQDPVPRLPPTALFDKYRHISPEYWLHGRPEDIDHWPTDNIKICEGGWSRECIASPLNGWNLSDHQSYFGSLQCWIPGTAEDCVIPEDAQAQLLALAEADV